MKKGVLLLLTFAIMSNALAQFFCGNNDTLEITNRSGCSRHIPQNAEDTMLYMQRFIPDESTSIKTIPLNINVWRNDDGTGSWWQDNQAFRDSMQIVIGYLNYIYANNIPFSDTISDAIFISDTKIRFEIDTFYYYDNTTIAHKVKPGDFNNYLLQNHSERLKRFNIHLSLGDSGSIAGWSSGISTEYQCFVCLHQYQQQHLWALASVMAHEFGHNCGLYHSYGTGARETIDITNCEFLWDLFGHTKQPWCDEDTVATHVCYHDVGWSCEPADPTTTCTNNIMGGTYLSRHFTALQCGRIHRALSTAPIRKYAYGYGSIPYVISSSQTWDFTRKMYQDIVIDSLATLTITCTLEMVDSARIIVRPGGKLIVDGGTLTNACDGEMWEGIVVEGNVNQRQLASKQGSVILTNATIKNARNAISTRGSEEATKWDKTGGIVQATNTLFHNNRRSAEFLSYENHKSNNSVTDNVSYFTRCTFTIDDNNLFAANGTSFENHVSMWQVRGVKFRGCAFRNEVTGTTGSARGKAIYTEEAGFLVKQVCPRVLPQNPCICLPLGNDTVTRSTFEGFYHAVHATSTLGSYDVTVDNCDFSQNGAGVLLSAADNARVSFNDFTLNSNLFLYYALGLDNCTGYAVESNAFHRQTYSDLPIVFGTMVDNSGMAENKIRMNNFLNLSIGCYVSGQNSSTKKPGPGLQFECNEFTGCYTDIGVSNGTVRSAQGSSTAGADNDFVSTLNSSINLSSANNINYWYSIGTGHVPLNPSTGVTLNNHATANGCASSLCDEPGFRDGAAALAQYRQMGGELSALAADYESRGYGENTEADEEAAVLAEQMSALSSAMGDLSRTEIRRIVSDSVVDMALLKEWYQTVPVPVAAYQLAEVYNGERNWSAAQEVLSSVPARFMLDSVEADEYRNYLALQQLRENVEGNWYRQSEREIEELQGVAEHNNGRSARMAKDILCFFHGICYEDDLLLDMDGMGERGLGGHTQNGRTRCVPTTKTGTITLYPNPTHNTLTVESASPIREIAVYDMTGRAVMVETMCTSSQQRVVNTSSLHAGIYIVKVITDKGTKTAKFVKR